MHQKRMKGFTLIELLAVIVILAIIALIAVPVIINNGNVAWISVSDYENANTDDNTNCEHDSCTDEGPLTAISVLKERTTYWTNIPEIEYTYSDDGGGNKYTSFTETMRAKMITYTEVNNIISANGGTLPEWMYINLNGTGDNNTNGYWLSIPIAVTSDYYYVFSVIETG